MDFKRIRLSQDSTSKLKTFKGRTGLTPNIACRLALCISIADNKIPSLELYEDDTGQEINRYTFLGEHELILLSIFTQWCHDHKIDNNDYYKYLHAHINRGVEMLTNRVKGLEDFVVLLKGN